MNRYQGKYNYQNQVHTLWTHAKNIAIAHINFIKQLQEILGISGYRLRCYFSGQRDNFKIKENKPNEI